MQQNISENGTFGVKDTSEQSNVIHSEEPLSWVYLGSEIN